MNKYIQMLESKGFYIDNVNLLNGRFFRNLDYAFTTCIFGPVKSGKSWLIRFLIELFLANKAVDAVYVFRGNANDDYVHLEQTGTVFDGFDEEILSQILEEQTPTSMTINGVRTNIRKPPIMIVFDDVVGQLDRATVQGKRSKSARENVKHTVQDLFAKLRHYNVFPVVAVQQAKMFPQYIKTSVASGMSFCFNPGTQVNALTAKELFPELATYTGSQAYMWFNRNKKKPRHMWVIDGQTQEIGELKVGDYELSYQYYWGDENGGEDQVDHR